MPEFFQDFFASLPPGSYCLQCLAALYSQPVALIRTALAGMGTAVVTSVAQCSNCERTVRTFRKAS